MPKDLIIANSHSAKSTYDPCYFRQQLDDMTSLLPFHLSDYKHENCRKCGHNLNVEERARRNEMLAKKGSKVLPLVDIESELRNQTRYYSRCPEFKYHPDCLTYGSCIKKNDERVVTELPPRICDPRPVTIPRPTYVGYQLPDTQDCGVKAFHTQF